MGWETVLVIVCTVLAIAAAAVAIIQNRRVDRAFVDLLECIANLRLTIQRHDRRVGGEH